MRTGPSLPLGPLAPRGPGARRPLPIGALAAAAGLALAGPVAAPAARAQDDAAIRALKQQVEEIRGLKFERPVKVERRGKDDLRAYMEKSFAEEVPEADTALAEALMKQLGLLGEDKDLRQVYLELLSENVAGFYDPKDGTLWIIDPAAGGGDDDPAAAAGQDDMVILHELIHALEDQHFDLRTLDAERKGNDDRLLALQLLVEGSATYGMFQPVVGPAAAQADRDAQRWMFRGLAFTMDLGGAIQPQESEAPDFLMRLLIAPYAEGVKFVGRVAEDGGYEAVSRAYAAPPRSTEQVLHPEKLLGDDADEPVERRLPDLGAALGPDWRPLGQNTMGELQTRLVLQRWLVDEPALSLLEELPPEARKLGQLVLGLGSRLIPDRDPVRVAEGWGGDRYQVLHHTLGHTAVVWWTTWDTEADADELENALGLAVERHPGIAVDRRGREVVVLFDVPEESRAAVLARLRPEVF